MLKYWHSMSVHLPQKTERYASAGVSLTPPVLSYIVNWSWIKLSLEGNVAVTALMAVGNVTVKNAAVQWVMPPDKKWMDFYVRHIL